MIRFWAFTVATAIGALGNTFLYVAVPWALYATTDSAAVAILSVAAQASPYLLAPVVGPLIDRHSARHMVFVGEVVQGLAVAAIPITLMAGYVGLVYVELFVIGLASVVSDVAGDYGVLPSLVPSDLLDWASSTYTSAHLVARFAGPALAGLVISTAGAAAALYLDALTFALSAVVALFMPRTLVQHSGTSFEKMLRQGFAFFVEDRRLVTMTLVVAIYNLGGGALEATLVTVAQSRWGWSAAGIGIAISVAAVAAAAGAWLSGRIGLSMTRERRISSWLAVSMVGAFLLAVPGVAVPLVGYVLLSFGEGGVNVTTMSYRLARIPPSLSGRVNSVIRTFITGAVPISAVVLGATASRFESNVGIFSAVLLTATLAVIVWLRASQTFSLKA